MVKLFVEGGGNTRSLKDDCRHGFSEFLSKAGFSGRMPRIVACGSRNEAYEDFCTALRNGEKAFLLVDSESDITVAHQTGTYDNWLPWAHLLVRDRWEKPTGADEHHCHLMVQSMETWLLADRNAIAFYYGAGFNSNPIQARVDESLTKQQVLDRLNQAVRNCTAKGKNIYSKGNHSFKILEKINPNTVTEILPWAKRFVDILEIHLEPS
jgi:hypothetical protein